MKSSVKKQMRTTTLSLVILALLAGCAGLAPRATEPKTVLKEEAALKESAPAKREKLVIAAHYDERSILMPIIQLSLFTMSADYFGQFVWEEDYIFPDYLFKMIGKVIIVAGQATPQIR